MPYITKEQRDRIDRMIFPAHIGVLSDGELNYFLTKILLAREPSTYSNFMSIIGTLECVKQEFYRRAVAPYEDKKQIANGDVYP